MIIVLVSDLSDIQRVKIALFTGIANYSQCILRERNSPIVDHLNFAV